MPAYKNKESGKWYVVTQYTDWTGARKQKCKRGFDTRREALEWEQKFQQQSAGDLDMSFEAFVEIYTTDLKARLKESTFIREKLCADDYVVFCDSGLKHLEQLQAKPSLIVGDFDSHENPHLDVETIVLPCEKDDTDTVFAVKEAIKRGFEDFLLIGVVGARLDHTLGNVSILLYLDSLGKKGCIIDDYSEMEIVSDEPVSICDQYSFFSLLNITGCAKGITITGAKFPLVDAEISCEYQYGVSNEVLPGETATVSVKQGKLLLIKNR